MKFLLIYPKWEKLDRQTRFTLPPHGPVVMAAALPADVDVKFIDENVEPIDFDAAVDFVGVSMMLTAQVKRGWEIADAFRARGIKVICGGIATMLHAEESELHADAVFMGEAEGRMEQVFADFKADKLQKVYNYMQDHPPIESVGTARRSILNRDMYNYRGVQMVDLVHASRGCRFNCYPCAVRFLGGRSFRPRPYDKVIEEMAGIDNNRLFIVDNSLAQDKDWEMGLFREMIPLKKKWCSHPIDNDDQVLDLAAQAGAWFVYQAIFDSSDYIRDRIKRYHDHGIGVEGSIFLGWIITRKITSKAGWISCWKSSSIWRSLPFSRLFRTPGPLMICNNAGRIFSRDWNDYTCGKVVFQPKLMSPEKLQEIYAYCLGQILRGRTAKLQNV